MTFAVINPNLDHLNRLTGPFGLFEHARMDQPRFEQGYTVDDNARALVVLARANRSGATRPYEPYLEMVLGGRVARGWHNRMSQRGEWTDRRGSDDAQGRAIWGLGELIGAGCRDQRVLDAILSVATFRSSHLRSLSYAILGAVAALEAGILEPALHDFIDRTVRRIPRPLDRDWVWPEERLTYANARIPEALIKAGKVIGEATTLRGLDLLHWLIEIERGENGFSFTPVEGRRRGERGPAFDQQPIEAWAMADACASALEVDDGEVWRSGLEDAAYWFLGRNDTGANLYDPTTGAGFDGLQQQGVNANRGAESTLSAAAVLGRLGEIG